MRTSSFLSSTVAALTAEGFAPYGEGEQFFGSARAKCALYRRPGTRTPATVGRMVSRQSGEIETWRLMSWKDHGATIVAVRLDA